MAKKEVELIMTRPNQNEPYAFQHQNSLGATCITDMQIPDGGNSKV